MSLLERFNKTNLTYADIAHELGCCEVSARNKIAGKTRVSKVELEALDRILTREEQECSTSRLKS